MFELPLFPLNSVIFPGTPIILHIFEDRYKAMFKECMKEHKPFGVTLIKEGVEANGPLATPYDIGCTARITMVEQLKDDRMNIIAIGGERFKVANLNYDREYLVGDVDIMPLLFENRESLGEQKAQLRPWVDRYIELMLEADLTNSKMDHFPADPIEFVYQAAYLLQIPNGQKQQLLETEHAVDLMSSLIDYYRREVALFKNILKSRRNIVQQDPILN